MADLAVMFAAAFRDDAMIRWPMPDATPAMLAEFFGVLLTPYARSGVLWKIHGYDGAAAGYRQRWPGGSATSSNPPAPPSTR